MVEDANVAMQHLQTWVVTLQILGIWVTGCSWHFLLLSLGSLRPCCDQCHIQNQYREGDSKTCTRHPAQLLLSMHNCSTTKALMTAANHKTSTFLTAQTDALKHIDSRPLFESSHDGWSLV